jgi:hypothetical protein
MNKIIEKIKDIVYDSFDYIVMLGIVVLVVAIIGWRLDVLFAKEVDSEVAGEPVVIDVDRPKHDDNEEPNDEEETDEPGEEPNETPEDNQVPPSTTGEVVKINIPAGSLPGKIGLILEENGLIDSSKAFIAKAVELKLDTKLKSGTFEIAKGSSYEDILKIISK